MKKVEFTTKAGYQAIILLMEALGTYCGYVIVKEDHAAFGTHYNDKLICGIEVHGGVTFSDCINKIEEFADADNDCRALGFDCAHYGDIMLKKLRENKMLTEALIEVLGKEAKRTAMVAESVAAAVKIVKKAPSDSRSAFLTAYLTCLQIAYVRASDDLALIVGKEL